MSESAAGVFKILFKIPIIILVSYMILNLFAFGVSYFKMLGLSYIVMQTAVENNFIPPTERASLENYMATNMETGILNNVRFTDDTAFTKQQYGLDVVVGIEAHYTFLWPLMPRDQVTSDFQGMSDRQSPAFLSESQLSAAREAVEKNERNNIIIKYTVPGLKYYPDIN